MIETQGNYYVNMINSLPAGLDRAILSALSFHVGAEKAIKLKALKSVINKSGFPNVGERQVRQTISDLRKAGVLIGSSAGKDAGYFMLSSWKEVDDFTIKEMEARIIDLAKSKRAVENAAAAIFGEKPIAFQDRLF